MNVYQGTNITLDMLQPDFWLSQVADPDQVWLTPTEIQQFNEQVYHTLNFPKIFDLPPTLTASEVEAFIDQYKTPTRPRFGGAGQPLDAAYFQQLQHNAHPDLPAQAKVRYGIAVHRTAVRSFPTCDIATNPAFDFATDYFQETSIDIGWAVAVLATSRDQQWYFCLTPLYWGWVAVEDIAVGTQADIQAYTHATDYLVVTASQALVGLSNGSGITPQMGTRLPLLAMNDEVYTVHVPQRAGDGTLIWTQGYVPCDSLHVHHGDVPLTLRNIFTHAFSLLEERYAWGCSRLGIFGRDCSRYIKDVYAITGITLPRNADEQGEVGLLRATFEPSMSNAQMKQIIVAHGTPGDLLVTPDHIMLYLGHMDGEPYVIHAKGGKHKRTLISTLMINEDEPIGAVIRAMTRLTSVR